jgi:hypothetical protein
LTYCICPGILVLDSNNKSWGGILSIVTIHYHTLRYYTIQYISCIIAYLQYIIYSIYGTVLAWLAITMPAYILTIWRGTCIPTVDIKQYICQGQYIVKNILLETTVYMVQLLQYIQTEWWHGPCIRSYIQSILKMPIYKIYAKMLYTEYIYIYLYTLYMAWLLLHIYVLYMAPKKILGMILAGQLYI